VISLRFLETVEQAGALGHDQPAADLVGLTLQITLFLSQLGVEPLGS
jgi:hypothetical protein